MMHATSLSPDEQSESSPLLYNAVTNSLHNHIDVREPYSAELKHYKRRWYMLAVVAVLNLSNGMIWMTFSPIADSVVAYYNITTMQVNWLSIVFMVTSIPLAFFAIWLLDNHGFRVTLILAAWLNGVGASLRIISALGFIPPSYRYPLLLTGQTLAGCAQPLVMFTPTKLAAQWFGEHQRTIANAIGSTANPIGVMLGGIISAAVVQNTSQAQERLPMLLEGFAAPAVLGVVMATFGVWSSRPPTPPSTSAAEGSEPFCDGIKKLLRNRPYWILALCYGGGMGVISTLVTIMDQLLCPNGYSDMIAGLYVALIFGVGLLGATVASFIVDQNRKFEEVAKVGFGVCSCLLITFIIMSHYPNQQVLLGVLAAGTGFFGLALNPICLELSVECSFPVSEGTSAGLLILSGQIQAVVYSFLMTLGVDNNMSEAEMCARGQIIHIYGIVGFIIVLGVVSLAFIVFFRCNYRRLRIEEQIRAENILNATTRQRDRTLTFS